MDAIQQYLQVHPFFRELDSRQREEIKRLATIERLSRGEILALEGEPSSAVYLVVAGRVRAYKISPQGREQVVSVSQPNDAFYVVPALDGGPVPVTTQAVTRATLLRFSLSDFNAILRRFPVVALNVATDLARRLRRVTSLVEDLSLRSVPARLAKLLLATAHAATSHRLTQREMAAQLGTVREVVARCLSQFEQQGWILLERGVIEIVDAHALEELTQQ